MEVSPPSTSPHARLQDLRVAGDEHRRRRHHHHHQWQEDPEEVVEEEEQQQALLHPHHQGAEANGEAKEVVEDDDKQAYQRHMLFSRHYSFHVNSHPNHQQPQRQLQQQQQHQQPTFSRHASFNLPPRSKPPGSTAPSFASLSSSSSMFSRAPSFQDPKSRRALDRIVSMDRHQAPEVNFSSQEDDWKGKFVSTRSKAYGEKEEDEEKEKKRMLTQNSAAASVWKLAISALSSGKRSGPRKLLMLIILNFAYSFVELFLGLISGHIGLVSDAFHLTFGCGLLSFSFIAMLFTKKISDETYTYGYKRLEVLAAFTNAIFLLFLSFSLAVEALHAFIQDESEHKHYLIVSAVTNLFVNLVGVWFFRGYARIRIAYRKAEDMNYHSIFLHVLADSIRSAGLILASWLLTLGVNNAETLCLGLVAIAIFLLVMPLFKATAGVLLQMSPQTISASVLHKCYRQVILLESILECQARFWEMVPGFVVGTIILQVKEDTDDQKVLKHVHSVYNDIGIKDLTVQLEVHV